MTTQQTYLKAISKHVAAGTCGALLSVMLLLSACGNSDKKPAASQVAVIVNDGEISVHQLNYVLQRSSGITPQNAEASKRQLLNSLVDQELVVQQALESKLDRSPEVGLALEAARREVLARAYFDQLAGAISKPPVAETKKFYEDNPNLFANRKIYRVEEVSFAANPELVARVKSLLLQRVSVADIVSQLKASGVQVMGGVEVKAAEQITLDKLPKIAQATEGQPQVFEESGRAAIVTVLASKAEPVDESKALPAIEAYLVNKQKTDLAANNLKQLRDKAKIEYLGEFATHKPVTAPAEKSAPSPADESMQKGLSGLK
jgi:EpsD family peptidyl-prolyl cis-trans isomerase